MRHYVNKFILIPQEAVRRDFTYHHNTLSMLCASRYFAFVQRVQHSRSAHKISRSASPIVLRPYQESCLDACTTALESGISRIGVSLPTGAGKTTVFISLLDRILPPEKSPNATRALIVVNSIELARQSAAQTQALFPEWGVEIEQGIKHKASGLADVYVKLSLTWCASIDLNEPSTIATYQTLLQAQRLAKFDPKGLKAVIIDEAHHAAAPS